MKRLCLALALATFGCGGQPHTEADAGAPRPGRLRAGLATAWLDVPVGVPTGGNSKPAPPAPQSPWSDKHPATTGVQTTPTARALALSDGVTTVVLVRLDLCLTTATLRLRAQEELASLGATTPLIVSSTHTHSGPGRYFHPAPADGTGGFDPTVTGMDVFDPEVESRIAKAIARAAADALAVLRPVSLGVATVELPEFNADRRCENDDLYGHDFRDTTLTLLRFDEVDDEGQPTRPFAGLIHYAMHGTFLGSLNPLHAVDAPGALELYGSDAVGVPLVYLQGAAGDVSPRAGAEGFSDFQAMERLGVVAGARIADAFQRAQPGPAPAEATLVYAEHVVTLSRAGIGYAPGEFPENGGIGCGLGASACPAEPVSKAELICLPLARRSFRQTSFAALRLGDVLIGTLPGEPTAAVGERVKTLGATVPGVTHVLTAGYAMDHFGYLLEEADYLRLGYEPSVSPWGWRFGEYALEQLGETFSALGTPAEVPTPPPTVTATPRPIDDSSEAPGETLAPTSLSRLDTARFAFAGGDPALGTPAVSLELEVDGAFTQVMASALRPVVNGPEVVLRLALDPTTLDVPAAASRTFTWTAEWETLPSTPEGRYRFVARGRARRGGVTTPYEVASTPFEVTRSRELGARAQLALSDGRLSLVLRFPPNPTQRDADGRVTGHYRLRDADDAPSDGARGHGGTVQATVTAPGGTPAQVQLTWSDDARAFVAAVQGAASGEWVLEVAPHDARDGAGNDNAQALRVAVER